MPNHQCLLFRSLARVSVHRPHQQLRKFSIRGLVRYEIIVLFPVPIFDPVHQFHCERLVHKPPFLSHGMEMLSPQ